MCCQDVISRLTLLTAAFMTTYRCVVIAETSDRQDSLLCRSCGHEVTMADQLVTMPTPRARGQRNDTILGVHGVLIQLLVNPHGVKFELITARTADVYKYDKAVREDTWFDGYSWRLAVCPSCGAHLGWSFEPHGHQAGKSDTEHTFIGLILDKLLHKNFADSLLVTPKLYTS